MILTINFLIKDPIEIPSISLSAGGVHMNYSERIANEKYTPLTHLIVTGVGLRLANQRAPIG